MTTAYRYTLRRGPWLNGTGTVLFIMLNPSTADESLDDPTIRRCAGFARSWGFEHLTVGNLYALRATKPDALRSAEDPVGARNDYWLAQLADQATKVIVAWGSSPHPQPDRAGRVLELVNSYTGAAWCLGRTKDGHPRHPLYVPRTVRRVLLEREAVAA